MRTTVTLDDDVSEAARAQAQASGKRLGEVLSQLARRGLRASAQTASKSGLPVFKIRPDAEIIPSNRAKELLAEDVG
jgi:hypothetical protein